MCGGEACVANLQAGRDGVGHDAEAGGQGVAGCLQARAQLGFDVRRVEPREAVADQWQLGVQGRAQLREFAGRVGARQARGQGGQAGVAAHRVVQGVGGGQGLADDGLLAADHALEADPADDGDDDRAQRPEQQAEHQPFAQAEAAPWRGFHVRWGVHIEVMSSWIRFVPLPDRAGPHLTGEVPAG